MDDVQHFGTRVPHSLMLKSSSQVFLTSALTNVELVSVTESTPALETVLASLSMAVPAMTSQTVSGTASAIL